MSTLSAVVGPPAVDWPSETMEWSSPEAARLGNFGAVFGGPKPERYRRHCRTTLRGLLARWPRCGCAATLQITVPDPSRPESARLSLSHASSCPRFLP